jgi:hypothetical protein
MIVHFSHFIKIVLCYRWHRKQGGCLYRGQLSHTAMVYDMYNPSLESTLELFLELFYSGK